ncbi:cytochrome c oxidase assembly factor 7 homolog [Belonocnema kinseyi]|uniref:cytochrome c oxidase assembly factor 7 homolog n=1 Tax=Belonocnema kinseyi TaxID=2817044 RepID=UPI00143D0481|nr:cytochrome c oxidase assembly factor 7 homolog [Belonocnema kinseyi]
MTYDLKNEDDVKEYLKNLHTEYSFGCFSEKNPEVCHLLGEYYEAIKRDFKKSAEIHKNNCDNFDYGRSCTKYGRLSVIGEGCKKDAKTAFEYMRKGCELKDGAGCLYAGLLACSKDDVGRPDKKLLVNEGVAMMDKACSELNEPRACFYLSTIYLGGISGYFEKNLRKAYKLSLKCCENGNPYACANIAQMHARGEGVEKNKELADTFRKRAVELENEMKSNQGIQFQQGIDT